MTYVKLRTFNSSTIINSNDWLTWSPAVSTGLVARHVSKLCDDGSGKFLEPTVLDVELVSSQCCVQGLLLAVLQHRHPAEIQKNIQLAPKQTKGLIISVSLWRSKVAHHVFCMCFFLSCPMISHHHSYFLNFMSSPPTRA